MNYNYPGQNVVTAQIGRQAHPDVLANLIAQNIVAYTLSLDPYARADVNTTIGNDIIISGQIKLRGPFLDFLKLADIAKDTVDNVGYSQQWGYDTNSLKVHFTLLNGQSENIAAAVNNGGAGDTITKVGFASDETDEYLPLPNVLVRKIAQKLDFAFQTGLVDGLGPDGKLNIAVVYENGSPKYVSSLVVAAQHQEDIDTEKFKGNISDLVKSGIGKYYDESRTRIIVNGAGLFVYGGPTIDTGVKGKKDADHTYGNLIGHTGGSAYGKDPTKVDFHGLIAARYVAKNIVKSGLAHATRVELTYAIGLEEPIEIAINTFGTSDMDEKGLVAIVRDKFDLKPQHLIEELDLRNPKRYPGLAASFFDSRNPIIAQTISRN